MSRWEHFQGSGDVKQTWKRVFIQSKPLSLPIFYPNQTATDRKVEKLDVGWDSSWVAALKML